MKLKRPKDDYLYYNKDHRRKKQIYDWTRDILKNAYNDRYRDINSLILKKPRESYRIFKSYIDNLINGMITYENGDTLGYLLIINMDQYGKNTIVNDLFNNIITIPLLKKKSITEANKKKLEKLKDEEIKTTTKKTKPIKTSIITKGIDKQGKQKEAKIEYVIVNKKPQKRIRDIKTGRFLKSL